MRFFEFESRKIVAKAGIPVSGHGYATTPAEARRIAEGLGAPTVIKSQVLTGGRMKAGGVKFADAPEDAERLSRLLRGIPAKINLIPINEHPGAPYSRPSDARIDRFAAILAGGPIGVSVRRSRGDDVYAACGQLGARAQPPDAQLAGRPTLAGLRTGHAQESPITE